MNGAVADQRANTPLARAIREDRAILAGRHATRTGSMTSNRMSLANLALYRRRQPMHCWSYDLVWLHGHTSMQRALAMQDAFSACRRYQPPTGA